MKRVLYLLLAAGRLLAQTTIFESDFEIGDLTEWNQGITCTPSPDTTCSVAATRPHSGLYSAKHIFTTSATLVQSLIRYDTINVSGYATVYARVWFYMDTGLSTTANSDMQILQLNASGGHAVQIHNSGTAGSPEYHLKLSGGATLGSTTLSTGQWYSVKLAYVAGAGTGTAAVYLDGGESPEVSASSLTLSNVTSVLVGVFGYPTGTIYFDDVFVSTADISYSASAIRLRHANSFGRSALPLKTYLYGWTGTDILTVDVGETEVYRQTVTSGLMTPVVNMAALSAATHSVTVKLLNSSEVEKATYSENIVKYVSGTPFASIDANNAINYGGAPIFPVTAFEQGITCSGGSEDCITTYLANGYINSAAWFSPWAAAYSASQYATDLASIAALSPAHYPAIGPDTIRWCDPNDSSESDNKKVCANIPSLADNSGSVTRAQAYATALAANTNLLGWTWMDEPDLGGGSGNVPAGNLQAITDAVRAIDGNHLNFQNLNAYGGGLNQIYLRQRQNFIYPNWNDSLTVTYPKMIAEVYASDYYPLIYQRTNATTLATWLSTMDSYEQYSFGLVPWMQFIEAGVQKCYDQPPVYGDPPTGYCLNGVGSGAPDGTDPGRGPTAAQLKMEAWLAVIHGAKGISWWGPEEQAFTYIDDANHAAMAAFTTTVTSLKSVILSAVPSRTVTDDSNVTGNRVDAMVRDNGSDVWVFAGRVTECTPGNRPLTCESDTLTTEFTVSGLTGTHNIAVYGESRSLTATDGVFTDDFAPDAVHIYQLSPPSGPAQSSAGRVTAAGRVQ